MKKIAWLLALCLALAVSVSAGELNWFGRTKIQINNFTNKAKSTFKFGLGQGQVTLMWDANTEEYIDGYKIHVGTASRSYNRIINVGNVTSYVVPNLGKGVNYYFAASAYSSHVPPNNTYAESGYSNEVSARP